MQRKVIKNNRGRVVGKIDVFGGQDGIIFKMVSGDRDLINAIEFSISEYLLDLNYNLIEMRENAGGGKGNKGFSPDQRISSYYSRVKRYKNKAKESEAKA